jgi:hypothetical protein
MSGEARPREVVEALSASVPLGASPVALGLVLIILDDLSRRAMRTRNAVGPTHGSDSVETPGVVNEVTDIEQVSIL